MFNVSDTQMDSLRRDRIRLFEMDLVQHLRGFAPRHMAVLGEEGELAAVRFGIERAGAQGFTARGPIRLFLETMFTLGGRFDEDPVYAEHFAGVFAPGDEERQMSRAKLLYTRLTAYLAECAGPGLVGPGGSAARLRERAATPLPDDLDMHAFLMNEAWLAQPKRVETLGEAGHARLISGALDRAGADGVRLQRSRALYGVLALYAGAGFGDDPLYPWIGGALRHPMVTDPDERAARLERRALTYLDAMPNPG